MKRIAVKFVPAALALVLGAPVAAQNGSAEPSAPATPASPPKSEPAPAPTAPVPAPAPVTVAPAQPIIVAPPVQAPPPPVAIQPDLAYPNGFADPAENYLLAPVPSREGVPWGLLGLLGLLGLIPLFRGGGRGRTVYVERDEEPRRVVRRERIEDE